MVIFDYYFKYIKIGDDASKSSLLLKYTDSLYNPKYVSRHTIGVEFGLKNINIRNKTYRIQIWSTSGKEHYKSIT